LPRARRFEFLGREAIVGIDVIHLGVLPQQLDRFGKKCAW